MAVAPFVLACAGRFGGLQARQESYLFSWWLPASPATTTRKKKILRRLCLPNPLHQASSVIDSISASFAYGMPKCEARTCPFGQCGIMGASSKHSGDHNVRV